MANDFGDIIDLSDSFTLADHRVLNDIVIDLNSDDSALIELDTDDSFVELGRTAVSRPVQERKLENKKDHKPYGYICKKHETKLKNLKLCNETISTEKKTKFGECPICFDPLGQNPLASTKCGHVYCMKCIERYLVFDKRCPTCRQNLKGKASYHPLYLNR